MIKGGFGRKAKGLTTGRAVGKEWIVGSRGLGSWLRPPSQLCCQTRDKGECWLCVQEDSWVAASCQGHFLCLGSLPCPAGGAWGLDPGLAP